MLKTTILLTLLLLLVLMSNNSPAFGNGQSLACVFHGTTYDIQFVYDTQQHPGDLCGLPDRHVIDSTPIHKVNQSHFNKKLDTHDPECFSWTYMPAQ